MWIMIPVALGLGGSFLIMFLISAWKGQYDDLDSPHQRLILSSGKDENEQDE